MHLPYIYIKITLLLFLFSNCKEESLELKSYNLPEVATVKTRKLFRIKNPTKDSFFRYIRKIHILSNGNLVVQNYPDHQLYEFSSNGKLLNIIGREGRGPGEFIETYMSYLSYNDSLHVYDFNNSRHQVLAKDDLGNWKPYRERIFRKINLEGMVEQVPEKVIYETNSDYYGIFRIFPTSRDTLSAHYAYVSKLNSNFEHAGKVSRLRIEEDLAIHRGNSSQTVHNNPRYYKAFYNFVPESNQVIIVQNNSNKIISIDSLNNESVIGVLPYDQFQLQLDEFNKSRDKASPYYSDMKDITKQKLLKHEPYYWNVILYNDLLWINLARSDDSKPNWIVSTLDGEIKEVFIGPKKISSVRIHGGFFYGVETDADGQMFLVGYSLESLKDTD